MYCLPLTVLLSTTTLLLPTLVSGAPAQAITKQPTPSGPGEQFLGSLTWYPQQPALLLATITNNSTTHYAILTKNNLFDDNHPYNPITVRTLSGAPVALRGTRYPYDHIEDAQFRDFPPGSAWERYFNMSDYMPPSRTIRAPESQCFSFQLPTLVEALALNDADEDQHLADIFLSQGLTNVEVASNPVHMNVTIAPGTPTAAALGAAVSIPAEPAGVFLPPDGQQVNVLQNIAEEGFLIGPAARTGTATT
ncbi:MAG: hypothetical protein L6R40_006657 [Gallowayella cf. fulva]|nr:MAG: hypothetical protein L6R40_006657 [Xanthomendoza cf. fulva]